MDGLFKNDAPRVRRRWAARVTHLRGGQGNRAGHHLGGDATATRRATPRTSSSSGNEQGVCAGRRDQRSGPVRAQSGLAAASSIRTPRWRRRRGARSTTCWSPTSCWCRASTIRSRPRPRRKDRHRLSGDPGAVESDDLSRSIRNTRRAASRGGLLLLRLSLLRGLADLISPGWRSAQRARHEARHQGRNAMTELSRRHLLTGAAAVGAAARLRRLHRHPRTAAAPPAGKQAPSFYRYKVGELRDARGVQRRRARRSRCRRTSCATSRRSRRWPRPKPPTCRRAWCTVPFNPHGRQHRRQAGADRHRLRAGHRADRRPPARRTWRRPASIRSRSTSC